MKFKFYALWLLLLCIIVFILQSFFTGFTEFFILDSSRVYEFWRFFTSMFLHADIGHLAYNMFALALFGSILEKLIGSRGFLVSFFVSGILANIISVNFYSSSLGASGAIFGVIGTLILVRPMMTIWAFSMPMPIFLAGILWAVGDLIGAYGFLVGNPLNNTGNIAHLSGMLIGLLLGVFYRDWKRKKEVKKEIIVEEDIRNWEDSYMSN